MTHCDKEWVKNTVNNSVWLNRFAFFVLFSGVVILIFALALQPKISDDWYLIWSFQESTDVFNFIFFQYTNWMGRLWGILLATIILPNPVIEIAYRAFIVLEIFLLIVLAWYCALGPGAWAQTRKNYQTFAIFGSLLWLALPSRDETVVWLAGNFFYLVSAIFALGFIGFIEHTVAFKEASESHVLLRTKAMISLSFFIGFSAGVSHEQVVVACSAYLALIFLRLKSVGYPRNKKVPLTIWFAFIGFVIGATVLVCAPGNYARMNKITSPSLFEAIERMVLFVPGAFFEIGSGSTGKNIWLAGLVFMLLHFGGSGAPGQMLLRLKYGTAWWIISFFSLLAMSPLTNFISPRTTFFAVIFLFIGFAAVACRTPLIQVAQHAENNDTKDLTQNESDWHFTLRAFVLLILSCLVFVEALAGLISNLAVNSEFARRIEIVEHANFSTSNENFSPIPVPYIATQQSSLTYIQSPEHDSEFLAKWGTRIGRPIVHDVSVGAPLPNSFKPLRAIKYRNR